MVRYCYVISISRHVHRYSIVRENESRMSNTQPVGVVSHNSRSAHTGNGWRHHSACDVSRNGRITLCVQISSLSAPDIHGNQYTIHPYRTEYSLYGCKKLGGFGACDKKGEGDFIICKCVSLIFVWLITRLVCYSSTFFFIAIRAISLQARLFRSRCNQSTTKAKVNPKQ